MKFQSLCLVFFISISLSSAQSNTFPSSGNAGIGTLSPENELHIKKNVPTPVIFKVENEGTSLNSHAIFVMKNSGNGNSRMQWVSAGIGTWYMGIDNTDATKVKFVWNDDQLENPALTLTKTGLVGINTSNPQSHLSVDGTIEAEKVKVIVDVPDYVFEEGYDRFTLPELEQFIKKNKHLPNVPSVNDADNDRGFINLGEFSSGTLENLETVILHLIEMDKRIKTLEKKNEELTINLQQEIERRKKCMNSKE